MAGLAAWSGERWLVEIVGWSGAVSILLAYLLVSAGRLSGRAPSFQWMNVLGAAGIAVNGWWHGALPSAVLNIIWMGIGAVALWQIRAARTAGRSEA